MPKIAIIFLFSITVLIGCSNDPQQNQQQLLDAAISGNQSQVSSLLNARVNPDCRDKCEWTPLMQAVLYNHPDIVKALLEKGATAELADQAGYNALLIAATHNRADMIPLLLAHQANINYQEQEEHMSALMIAARAGHKETVQVLLKNDADKTLLDKQGRTALKWAQLKQRSSIIQLLQ